MAHDLFLYEHRRSFILWQILTLRLLHEIWFKVSKVSILSKRYFSHSSLIFHYLSDIFSDLGRSIRDICGRCNRRKGIRVWIIADWYRIIPIVSAAARCFCHRVKKQEKKKSLTICHLTLVKLIRLRELKSFYNIVMYNDLLHEYMKNSRRREGRQNVFFKLNDHAVLINQYHYIEKRWKNLFNKICPKGKKDLFSMQNL